MDRKIFGMVTVGTLVVILITAVIVKKWGGSIPVIKSI